MSTSSEKRVTSGGVVPTQVSSTATAPAAATTTTETTLAVKETPKMSRSPIKAFSVTGISRIHSLYTSVPTDSVIPTALLKLEKLLLEGVEPEPPTPPVGTKKRHHLSSTSYVDDLEEERRAAALEDHIEMIEKAKEAIAEKAQEKIQQNDTVLIYGYSEIIKETIRLAVKNGKKFSLIIIESSCGCCNNDIHTIEENRRRIRNGQEVHALHLLQLLGPELKKGSITVTHTHLNGLSFVIRRVTKLFLSASALLTNGGILGRIGTAQVALMAHTKNIPVVVCCETFKFCDKSPSDSFFQNQRGRLGIKNQPSSNHEQGAVEVEKESTHQPGSTTTTTPSSSSNVLDGPTINTSSTTTNIEESVYLQMPILKYDITPSQFVTAVITEVDIFPATSIPLLLHVQETRNRHRSKSDLGSSSSSSPSGKS